jgi:hypothetical protein
MSFSANVSRAAEKPQMFPAICGEISFLFLLLGGAAVHRCDNGLPPGSGFSR